MNKLAEGVDTAGIGKVIRVVQCGTANFKSSLQCTFEDKDAKEMLDSMFIRETKFEF